jgi:hypothetical protein
LHIPEKLFNCGSQIQRKTSCTDEQAGNAGRRTIQPVRHDAKRES